MQLFHLYQKITGALRDFFFPLHCFVCHTAGYFLCASCSNLLPNQPITTCFVCGTEPARFGEKCFVCIKNDSPLDAVYGAFCYDVPIIKSLLHQYKYQFFQEAGLPLGELFGKRVLQSTLPLPDMITFVPLHPRRLRFRGFNQSEHLATILAEHLSHLNIPLVPLLARTHYTQAQQSLSRQQRLQNVLGAFSRAGDESITHKTVWIIDDVSTTHSTLSECAKILKTQGAKKVYGVVVARK